MLQIWDICWINGRVQKPFWFQCHGLCCLTDDDWQEAHERLAELEEKPPDALREQTGNGERDEMDLLGDHEENLAERLSKMVIENELEDPAIMRAVHTRPVLQVSHPDFENCGTH